jgi:hypothetical protein
MERERQAVLRDDWSMAGVTEDAPLLFVLHARTGSPQIAVVSNSLFRVALVTQRLQVREIVCTTILSRHDGQAFRARTVSALGRLIPSK